MKLWKSPPISAMVLKKRNPFSTRQDDTGLNKLLQLEIEDYFMILFFYILNVLAMNTPRR